MASIPGSQFGVTAGGSPVHIVETSGGAFPPPVPGSFNLEVWTGPLATAPNPLASGYQAEAVLGGSGGSTTTLTLLSGTLTTTISSGGTEDVSAGSTASGTTINSGGT